MEPIGIDMLSFQQMSLDSKKENISFSLVKKFDTLKDELIASGITSANILKLFVSLIFEMAVTDPTSSPLYVQLLKDLNEKLPPFPSDEPGGREITVRRVLLSLCQEAFEGAENSRAKLKQITAPEQEMLLQLRFLGNLRLIGELTKQKMGSELIVHRIVEKLLGTGLRSCPAEENVEAACQFLGTVGKHYDKNPYSRRMNDQCFNRLKDLASHPQLSPKLRIMVRDILDLRRNNWIPRQEEVSGDVARSSSSLRSRQD